MSGARRNGGWCREHVTALMSLKHVQLKTQSRVTSI